MEHINAFGHSIVKLHCPFNYATPELLTSINRIFDLPEVRSRARGAEWDSHYGLGETTEINPYLGPANIPDAQSIVEWILNECLMLYGEKYTVDRSWMNRMLTGSQGRCHNHVGKPEVANNPDLVAIFYITNGSSLVVVDGNRSGALPSDIPEENKYYIQPEAGDLVIHTPEIWHAVSEHTLADPRICFVFQLTK